MSGLDPTLAALRRGEFLDGMARAGAHADGVARELGELASMCAALERLGAALEAAGDGAAALLLRARQDAERMRTSLGDLARELSAIARSAAEAPPAPAPAPAPAPTSAPARVRVLVIDDEAALAAALQSLLAEGHDVAVLTDAIAARDAFAAGARYDAVICDLMMPRLTGIELHAELVRIAPDQARRMIMMTGGRFTAEARQFLETSGVRWIEKPFRLDDLHRALGAVAP